jgi:hypothetical protein
VRNLKKATEQGFGFATGAMLAILLATVAPVLIILLVANLLVLIGVL